MLTAGNIITIIGSALALLLAAALLILDPHGRQSRWFALYLTARAIGESFAIGASRIATETWATGMHHVAWYWRIFEVGALAMFLLVYPRPRGWFRPWVPAVVMAPLAALLVTFTIRPDWLVETTFTDHLMANDALPLGWFVPLREIAAGIAAIILFVTLQRTPEGPRRDVLRLLTIGFWIHAGLRAGIYPIIAVAYLRSDPSGAEWIPATTAILQVAVILAALGASWWGLRRRPGECIRFASGWTVLVGASFFAFGVSNGFWGSPATRVPLLWLDVVGYVALPVLATYALLRCSMFDIRVRARGILSRSTVAALVGAVFWVIITLTGEYVEYLLGDAGFLPAVIAGATVAALLRPIMGVAERIAEQALPGATPFSTLEGEERERALETQTELADNGDVQRKHWVLQRMQARSMSVHVAHALRR